MVLILWIYNKTLKCVIELKRSFVVFPVEMWEAPAVDLRHLSILRNPNVPWRCHLILPMSHVELKKIAMLHIAIFFVFSLSHVPYTYVACRF